MALTAPKGKAFDPAPAGSHVARLYQIIHIGTITTEFKGEKKQTDKIRLTFELCNETKVFKEGEEAKPLSVSREFSFYMSPKANLRQFVEGMIGTRLDEEEAATFDLEGLLSEDCLLNIVHSESKSSGNIYADIKSASPLPKGMTAPTVFNTPTLIDVNSATEEQIDALPEFIRDKMKSSEQFDARFRQGQPNVEVSPDDIPF